MTIEIEWHDSGRSRRCVIRHSLVRARIEIEAVGEGWRGTLREGNRACDFSPHLDSLEALLFAGRSELQYRAGD